MPGLDGLRAIAVLAVVAYHLEFSWAPGGLLGVGVFFTLSGYLITDLLLAQVASRGRIHLKSFWLARARRLLPALVVMLVVVLAWVTVIGPHQAPDFKDAAASGLFYFNNWWLIFHNVSYFAQFAAPAPLNHLWSLSIEEQFYILWPFMLHARPRRDPRAGRLERSAPSACRRHPGAGRRVGDHDDRPLPPGTRPIPGLLRNRHQGSGDPARGGAGDAVAEPATEPQGDSRGAEGDRRRGSRRARGDRAAHLAHRRVRAVPLPRRIPGAFAGHGGRRSPRCRIRPPASGGLSDVGRCAGSASAPTGSTCGTSRSSS